jgi:ribonuclease T1
LAAGGARHVKPSYLASVALADLPAEAGQTLRLIRQGGPFPYPRKDGSTFGNFEKRLPCSHAATIESTRCRRPAAATAARAASSLARGAAVMSPSGEYYYTDDHYRSFRRIRE